jgi:CheY-like chemotaxis protein
MPVMDGMQATHEIRNFEKSFGLTPAIIIALTGLASAKAQQEAFSNGIDLFLTKPVRFAELRNILEEWTPPKAKCVDNT